MKAIDHEYTDEIVCPYCGSEHTDSWEYEPDMNVIDCWECGREFQYERHISIMYSTEKMEE